MKMSVSALNLYPGSLTMQCYKIYIKAIMISTLEAMKVSISYVGNGGDDK